MQHGGTYITCRRLRLSIIHNLFHLSTDLYKAGQFFPNNAPTPADSLTAQQPKSLSLYLNYLHYLLYFIRYLWHGVVNRSYMNYQGQPREDLLQGGKWVCPSWIIPETLQI